MLDSVVECPPISSPPANGRFVNPPRTRYGSIVTLDCNEGYFLIGENNLQCDDEDRDGVGEWNNMIPNCRRKYLSSRIEYLYVLIFNLRKAPDRHPSAMVDCVMAGCLCPLFE